MDKRVGSKEPHLFTPFCVGKDTLLAVSPLSPIGPFALLDASPLATDADSLLAIRISGGALAVDPLHCTDD